MDRLGRAVRDVKAGKLEKLMATHHRRRDREDDETSIRDRLQLDVASIGFV